MKKTKKKVGSNMPYSKTIPLWVEIALAELGECEIPGTDSNTRINEYLKTCSLPGNDEIPWCSAFVNWVFSTWGTRGGTGSGLARSWLTWGEISPPILGAIVILRRPSTDPNAAHVGIQLDCYKGRITLIGGNQSNRVGISVYDTKDIIGIRYPKSMFKKESL